MLQSMDRLKVFYCVFSRGSVLEASKALHVSQSAVSQSLQKFESEIKSQLFTRMHKRLVPTEAGTRLFSVVQPFMTELDDCLERIQKARSTPFGNLRIGAPVEFGKAYFPAMLARFREQHPDVSFSLEFGDPAVLLPLVESGEIDFAFVDAFLTHNQFFANLDMFHFTPVVTEEIVLACSPRYYDEKIRDDHSLGHLLAQEFITYRHTGQSVKNWFKHHFDRFNVKFKTVLTVNSIRAVISSICHHAGMGIIATHLADDEIQKGLLVPVRTSRPDIMNQIVLTQLQDKRPTLTEKTFLDFFLKQIRLMGLSPDQGIPPTLQKT